MSDHPVRSGATAVAGGTGRLHVHEAHGWHIASQHALMALPTGTGDRGHRDLTVSWDRATTMSGPHPQATPLIRCETSGAIHYTATTRGDGYRLTFDGCCAFEVGDDLSTVACIPSVGVDRELTTVLATGALIAFVMALRDQCVLHASAVEVDGLAVAIVGGSGFGKSTVTAALCAAGCPLITDDVLRVDVDAESAPIAYRGTRELRLRAGARDLSTRFTPAILARETADGRLAIAPPQTRLAALPLGALVVPRPRADVGTPTVERLTPTVAVRHLLSYPRLLGWRDPSVLRRQLGDLAQLAQCTPMYVADLPLGPPFPHATARQLLAQLPEMIGPRTTV